jgi:hypothetical protein
MTGSKDTHDVCFQYGDSQVCGDDRLPELKCRALSLPDALY